jgi:hypothetical protein
VLFAAAQPAGAIQRWVFCNQNLWVDQNITNLIALMQRASAAGYTHMLLGDSKFSRLGTMDAHYFQNVNKVKQAATQLHLEIVPAVFPIGYSNDLLFNDPNLIEGMPATNALLIVSNGVARIQLDLPVAFPNGDFSNLAKWSWKDNTVVADNGTARVTNPNGANARIVQQFTVKPFRQYHISVQIKTQDFPAAPSVAVISSSGQSLNFNSLGGAGHPGLDHPPCRLQFVGEHPGQRLFRCLGWHDRHALVGQRLHRGGCLPQSHPPARRTAHRANREGRHAG